jgi:RNA polymerase sigma factor (sigma-70 family)
VAQILLLDSGSSWNHRDSRQPGAWRARRKDVTIMAAAEPAPRAAAPATADEALTALYAVHWRPLVRLAYLLLRDQQGAEDVVQDDFVATHRRWGTLRERDRAVAYLRTCVVNGVRSLQRHQQVVSREQRAQAGRADVVGRWTVSSAEASALRDLTNSALLDAVGRLPQRQREVLVLRYYADLSESQIADLLQVGPGSVKTHAHRALAALRASLGPDSQPEGDGAGE